MKKKNEDHIRQSYNSPVVSKNTKTTKTKEHVQMDKALLHYFKDNVQKGALILTPVKREKA